jgi:hypothetical protein
MIFFVLALISHFQSPAFARQFNYEDLVKAINSAKVKTVEKAIPLLPPEMRGNYTLLYSSRSLQEASVENPRVILFGKNAKFTCTFNGDVAQNGGDTIECFQFRDQERAFDFRQIQFPSVKNGLTSVRFSQRNLSADGRVSCTACHTSDPRPNWDEYRSWPGAFGESDDEITPYDKDYPKFVRKRSTHPRYQFLIQKKDSVAPFRTSISPRTVDPAARPNLRFAEFVNKWDALRMTRILNGIFPKKIMYEWALNSFCSLGNNDLLAARSGFPANSWSTRIFNDYHQEPYDHFSGFTDLFKSMGMVIVNDLASTGNQKIQKGLSNILNSRAHNGSDTYRSRFPDFYQALDSINFHFDTLIGDQENLICHELTRLSTGP